MAARKKTAAAAEPTTVGGLVGAMHPERRTTTEERRAVLLATLAAAAEMIDDIRSPSSARARALTESRQLVAALGELDAEEAPQPAETFGGLSVAAT